MPGLRLLGLIALSAAFAAATHAHAQDGVESQEARARAERAAAIAKSVQAKGILLPPLSN